MCTIWMPRGSHQTDSHDQAEALVGQGGGDPIGTGQALQPRGEVIGEGDRRAARQRYLGDQAAVIEGRGL